MSLQEVIEILKKFRDDNRSRFPMEKLGVFGSFARNAADEGSDLDIVVVLPRQDLFEIIGIKQTLEDTFHRHVDIVSYREKMNPFLKKKIDSEAVYV
jgi:predicted nucleotidyltransferase